jgi:hypothetical protein
MNLFEMHEKIERCVPAQLYLCSRIGVNCVLEEFFEGCYEFNMFIGGSERLTNNCGGLPLS